jgi:8-oxo-dGTP pyrophosphatase MutT (NUDIX family)
LSGGAAQTCANNADVIREAASVILLRAAGSAFEVFFVRRHRGASFMASASVFPGGGAENGEGARTTAARELREEAAVTVAPDRLAPWAHWITPSIEQKRFSAHFFVAELPPGEQPQFDRVETVDMMWVTPRDAIERAGEFGLPPPQIRTCWELAEHPTIAAVLAAARERAQEPHAILPRAAAVRDRPCLLLPWDPEYTTKGTGDAAPMLQRPRWARGPSRFVLEDSRWNHVEGPGSTSAASS